MESKNTTEAAKTPDTAAPVAAMTTETGAPAATAAAIGTAAATPKAERAVDYDLQMLRTRTDELERELAVRRALRAVAWFDPDDACRELTPGVARDAAGNWNAQRADGTHTALAEAVRELAFRKPHWVRATINGGSGAAGMAGGTHVAAVRYSDLLKPENARLLSDYVHQRPEELTQLRAVYFAGKEKM